MARVNSALSKSQLRPSWDARTLRDGTLLLLLCSDSVPSMCLSSGAEGDAAGAVVPVELTVQCADGYCELHAMVSD